MTATDETTIGSEPPILDEDEEWVTAAPPRRRWLSPVTLALVVALVAVGAFILGVEIEKGHAGTGSNGRAAGTDAAFARARGGLGGGGGASSGATIGTVKTIQGKALYVTSFTGNIVKVTTSASTRFTKSEQVTVQTVKPGDTVVVQGTLRTDGSITAASVTLGNVGGGFGTTGGGGRGRSFGGGNGGFGAGGG